VLGVGVALVLGGVALFEAAHSRLQARYFHKRAQAAAYTVKDGSSKRISFPSYGPHYQRRGYTRMPQFFESLAEHGFVVERQAQLCDSQGRFDSRRWALPYEDRDQAGLTIVDRGGRQLYGTRYPGWVFPSYDSIPPVIVQTLLFIEDRKLMDTLHQYRNPAVDWPRLGLSTLLYGASKVGLYGNVPGASTLATQIEKYRYWAGGLTLTPQDKLRQMYSASLRIYRDSENTVTARKGIVRSYLNTAPLAAFPYYGEVNGMGEGLIVWFGASADSVVQLLRTPMVDVKRSAAAYRMVVSLIIAHRRPSYYLLSDPKALAKVTDTYLYMLAKSGVVPQALCEQALQTKVTLRSSAQRSSSMIPLQLKKPVSSIRAPLLSYLELSRLYDLDRLDLRVETTLDSTGISFANTFFKLLRTQRSVDSMGLNGYRMLQKGNPASVIHSFSLYERVGTTNQLRIQADSYENPLNVNEGIKLDLGSTAKLRVLVSYLVIMESIYQELRPLSAQQLRARSIPRQDALSLWGRQKLMDSSCTLEAFLDAALKRTYSANPQERFFTGGGIHTFVNFDAKQNHQQYSCLEALKQSVNLPFVRLLRDVVHYYACRNPAARNLLAEGSAEQRQVYLRRFVEHEGRIYVSRFYRQLRSVPPSLMADSLAAGLRKSEKRLAAIYCGSESQPTSQGLVAFLARMGMKEVPQARIDKLMALCNNTELTVSDKGFMAGVHPLKLWVASCLVRTPQATLAQVQRESLPHLEGVYRWLLHSERVSAGSSRIQQIIEMDAFEELHQQWRSVGYPFRELVPSYATALGASADRPAALSELAGIIQNDGMRYPMVRISNLEFARATPFETVLSRTNLPPAKRVFSKEVAGALKHCLYEVVDEGTARRARGAFGSLALGGKTGTGDHRHRRIGRNGQRLEEKILNRTATFVFILGDRYFGTICAMVPGEQARNYAFTSSYPVQLLTLMKPAFSAMLADSLLKGAPPLPKVVQSNRSDTTVAVDEMSEQTTLDSFKVRIDAAESLTPLDHTDVDDDSLEDE
jgi:membrane peptidoglycan carboxypeptidase